MSNVILTGLLNKLPHEHEFENPVNISPPTSELKSFTPVLAFCSMSFFNVVHHFGTCPVSCESKNPASFVRALER